MTLILLLMSSLMIIDVDIDDIGTVIDIVIVDIDTVIDIVIDNY